jgi:polar amino acid transport system substrate-binding protein
MKKFLFTAMAAVMLMGVVGCGSTATDNEATTSVENGTADTASTGDKIIVGLDDEFSPMGFRDENNELVGFDIDLARAAGEKMGVEIEFQPIDWDTKEVELETNKIDLIWSGFTMTDDRLASMEFTKPYLDNRQVIMVKADSTLATKAELAGKNVGVQDGSSGMEAIEKDGADKSFADMLTYDTYLQAFTDLEVGRIDAVVVDEVVAKYHMEKNPDKFKLLDEDFGSEQYGIAAKKGNTELIDKLQTALDELNADGEAAEISTKWFGEDIVVK